MGKVGIVRLHHKDSGKTLYAQVNFYTKSKLFIVVDMPQEIKDWYGAKLTRENETKSHLYTGEVSAKSYDEVEQLAKKIYDEYYDLDVQETKLIAYKIKVNLPAKDGDYRNRVDIHNGLTYNLGLEYHILYRFKVGDEFFISKGTYEQCKMPKEGSRSGGYSMSREDSHQFGYTDFQKIEHTEEMENFFKNVTGSLEQLIVKITEFFGKDKAILLYNIATKGIHLLNKQNNNG